MANNLTAINSDQLLKGYGARSFYTIDGVVTKFIGTITDIQNTAPELPLRFIVKNPDGTITALGGVENDICVVNDDGTYSFIKPKDTTTILFLQGTCIYHFKNNAWNNIFRFSQASVIGEVPEAPEDSKLYARTNKNWKDIFEPFKDVPLDNYVYVRKNKDWSKLIDYLPEPVIPSDAPNDGKFYARRNKQWEDIINQGVEEAPNDNKFYIRKNKAWIEFEDQGILDVPSTPPDKLYLRKFNGWVEYIERNVEEAPNDNFEYLRKNKVWVKAKNVPFENDAPVNGKIYGRKDGDWAEVTGAGGGGGGLIGDHNTASNIQGGKVVGGVTTEAYHLTREEYLRLPFKPTIISPANNSVNINQIPVIHGSAYQHPFEYSMFGIEVLVSKTENFDNIIYTYNGYANTTSHQIPEKQGGNNVLETSTTYYVKIRYQDINRNWSAYSDTIKFETMIQFPNKVLKQPILTTPRNGGVIPRNNPILIMTQPEVNIGADNFISADWQIATDEGFNNLIYNKTDTPDLVYHVTQNVNLVDTTNNDFYIRGRQKSASGDFTSWSNPSKCKLRPEYNKPVIGLRRIFNKDNETILCQNIDENGDVIFLTAEYINRHPLFNFNIIEKDPIDTTTMQYITFDTWKLRYIHVPPVWMKNNVYTDGSNNMVIDVWFTMTEPSQAGWFLHPAFVQYPNGFYVTNTPMIYDTSRNYVYNYAKSQSSDQSYWNFGNDTSNVYVNNNITNFNYLNIYQLNLLYHLYMLKILDVKFPLDYYGYGSYSSYSGSSYSYFSKFSNFYFLRTTYNGQQTFGCNYNMVTGQYYISSPNRISKIMNSDAQSLNLDENDNKYNTIFNGDRNDTTNSLNCKILDIHKGSLPDYNNFNIALLSIPKEIEFDDTTKKSPFKKIYKHNTQFNRNHTIQENIDRVHYALWKNNSTYYYSNIFLSLYENGLMMPHVYGYYTSYHNNNLAYITAETLL